MDVLAELLPPNYTAKAEPSSKDSRRHQPQKKKQSKGLGSEPETEQALLKEKLSATQSSLPDSDRRMGEDRRQQRMKRGRWLESRDRNDRRATAMTVFVKV